jgi:hypothetical protein
MKKANISRGKTKMDEMVRRGELPCIRQSRSLCRASRSWCGVNVDGKKKSNEEAKTRIDGKKVNLRRQTFFGGVFQKTEKWQVSIQNSQMPL